MTSKGRLGTLLWNEPTLPAKLPGSVGVVLPADPMLLGSGQMPDSTLQTWHLRLLEEEQESRLQEEVLD